MSKRRVYSNDSGNPSHPKRHKSNGNAVGGATRPTPTGEYSIGWICAIPTELTAATAFLDEKFDEQGQNLPNGDKNYYTLGRVGSHYVVMTVLAKYGIASAATAATHMMRSFPRLKACLMVGIAGGAPSPEHDIRLGDIVISYPHSRSSGVLGYAFGKDIQGRDFTITAPLNSSPSDLLSTLNGLRAHHESSGHLLEEEIESAFERWPKLRAKFQRPSQSTDILYKSDVMHPDINKGCSDVCSKDMAHIISRHERRPEDNVSIHYGVIASADQVQKNAGTRDKLSLEHEVLCFEMEAAGLMNEVPCLIIRGICDYSDTHKNDDWQGYAAMAAAAYAKDFIRQIRPNFFESSHGMAATIPNEQRAERFQQFDADKAFKILKSLSFEQIGSREATVLDAHKKTCQWLLKSQEYLDWLDPSKLRSHHGFLWIRGNPGTGKSTLMKFALTNAQKKMKDEKIISFYFNARGAYMERCTIGMYRSLLKGLFERIPDLQHVLNSLPEAATRDDYNWDIRELKSLFKEAICSIQDASVVCFIDALDECDDNEIRDMVSFFQSIGESIQSENTKFLVCFSSRHYPNVSKDNAIYLTLEAQKGHENDIISFLNDKLKIDQDSGEAAMFREKVLKKSAGIFMWVLLVVDILNKDNDDGRIYELEKRLEEIPEDLHELFRNILKRDEHRKDELLLSIRWLIFSKQPLKPEEFYYAVTFGTLPGVMDNYRPHKASMDTVRKFIISCSKGFFETTRSKSPTVQFIHESVRDFLLKKDGLMDLCAERDKVFEQGSHEILKQFCLRYLGKFGNVELLESFLETNGYRDTRLHLQQDYPLLNYAVQSVLYHANAAGMNGTEQASFLGAFRFGDWVKLSNALEEYEARRYSSTDVAPLYIFAEHNAGNLIKNYPSNLMCFDIQETTHKLRCGPPIFAALVNNCHDAVEAFLEAYVEFATKQGDPKTVYLRGLYGKYCKVKIKPRWAKGGFEYKQHRGIVSHLAEHGNDTVTYFLLHFLGADIGRQDLQMRTPLMYAAENGHHKILDLLLLCQADIGAVDRMREGAHHKAARSGQGTTLKMLIDAGANVLQRRHHNETPLSLAIKAGKENTVEILLRHGADKEVYGDRGKQLLDTAVCKGDGTIVQMLQDAGAGVEMENYGGASTLRIGASINT